MEYKQFNLSKSEEALSSFLLACDEVISAKFILAEKKISALLQTIACEPLLIDFFKTALIGYNRTAEFARAKSKVGGRSKLSLPVNRTKIIAFAFCLLLELDTGKRDIKEFLDEYFYSPNPKEQYDAFVKTIVVPFKEISEYLFINGDDGTSDEAIDSALKESIKTLLQELNSLINRTAEIPTSVKQDLFLFARSIETALTPNRIDLVRPLMVGYKAIILSTPCAEKLMPYYDKLHKTLLIGDVL